ncbi:MAG: ATP-binding protein, partial [Nocardioides sp.]
MQSPPGSGKTMLARRLPTILPPLAPEPPALDATRQPLDRHLDGAPNRVEVLRHDVGARQLDAPPIPERPREHGVRVARALPKERAVLGRQTTSVQIEPHADYAQLRRGRGRKCGRRRGRGLRLRLQEFWVATPVGQDVGRVARRRHEAAEAGLARPAGGLLAHGVRALVDGQQKPRARCGVGAAPPAALALGPHVVERARAALLLERRRCGRGGGGGGWRGGGGGRLHLLGVHVQCPRLLALEGERHGNLCLASGQTEQLGDVRLGVAQQV